MSELNTETSHSSQASPAGWPEQPSVEALAQGQRRCRELTRQHGTTYFWGTMFLPAQQRRDVYGVYALCRLADDIVDEPDAPSVIDLGLPAEADPERRLAAFTERFYRARETGIDPHPVMLAIADTVRRLNLPRDCFERFFTAMRLDLTRTSWATWEELRDVYMEGSAAVIGEMMLPVLQPESPQALQPARALGLAFQLTNFIRDVGEDLDRGRVYLPADDLARFGADPWLRRVTPQWRAFLTEQIERNRELYRQAAPGVAMLPPAAARCVEAALQMYSAILTQIEEADYDVFSARRRVSPAAKTAIAGRVLLGGSDRVPIRRVPQPEPQQLRSTWRAAAQPRIRRALARALDRDAGGWYVVGASRDLGETSIVRTVSGVEVALWRTADGQLRAGPGACPHFGAKLEACPVGGDDLLCRWHGLALPSEWPGDWRTLPAHDDGVLLWVRLDTPGETASEAPVLATRPPLSRSISSVYSHSARCEPQDIIANRLDPWHGSWLHPYAFSHLVVDDEASTDDCLVTDVTFRLNHTWGVPVRAEFTCPDSRTIVMHIVAGEGAGSVVETHATPIGVDADGLPRTVMTEATIADSDRPGFRVAKALTPLIRPLMVRTQAQLWVDDLEYAERRYQVRTGRVGR